MSNVILKAENISKQYRLGLVGTGTIAHDLNRWWHTVRGKEDPYLKIGAVNDRSAKANSTYVWALKDINFEVQQGEVLGIIGKNGAGKSTLLKLLSRVTSPTTGVIKTRGRIASLLEVGTGFHPELTGRENIYLNGAILGMTKAEIASKIDEIVDFSGCEMYIDTPTKRYSSGMTVRLAFAVAAHLEPDILVVDEVLAVGDAEFQKKAIGKMQDISTGDGRTVLFVSHNMASVKQLCTRAIVLEHGLVSHEGAVDYCVEKYLEIGASKESGYFLNEAPKEESDILELKVMKNGKLSNDFQFNQNVEIYIKLKQIAIDNKAVIGIRVQDNKGRNIFSTQQDLETVIDKMDLKEFIVQIPKSVLVPNTYFITVGYHIPNVKVIRYFETILTFTIEETGSEFAAYHGRDYGCIIINCKWRNL